MKRYFLLLKISFWAALVTVFLTTFFGVGYTILSIELPKSGEPAHLYSTQTHDDLRLVYDKAIDKAEHSILLIVYSLTDKQIIDALRRKSESGIDVQVIGDAEASQHAAKKLGPSVNTFLRKGKGLMHQKILVIDGRQVWIGSANMTTASLRMHGNLVMGFDSPELAAMVRQKADAMTKTGPQPPPLAPKEFHIGDQMAEMNFLPDYPEAVQKLKLLMRSAQKTIKVAMFTWTRYDLAQEMVDAKERGLDVQAVIDGNSGNGVGAKVVAQLQEGNVPVRLNQGSTLLHHKFMVIDDKILVNGSANWTLSAFNKNDDCFILLKNLTEFQENYLKELWQVIVDESEPAPLQD